MPSGSRRGWWLAGVLALGATALWVVALLRLQQQVEARPADERFLTWVTPDGPLGPNPSFPHCGGPALVATDRAWRTCHLTDPSEADRPFIVRFELDRKRAILIPLPAEVRSAYFHAAALGPDGDLAVVVAGTLFRISGDLAVAVGQVSDFNVAGIAWVDGAIEVVEGTFEPELIRFTDPPTRRALARPADDKAGYRVPWLQHAWRGPSGWHLLYDMRYLGRDEQPRTETEVLEGDERGERWSSTRVPSDPVDTRLSLDGARGGVMARSPDWRWYLVRAGDRWTRFAHPLPADAEALDRLTTDYLIGAGELTALHRFEGGTRGVAETPSGWIDFGYEYDGKHSYLHLRDLAGQRGPRMVGWGWIDSNAIVVPASAGGSWLLGAFGTYIRIDGLHRADAPDALGRYQLLSANLDRLGRYSDWYGEDVGLKRASFPIVLLGWPVAALAALISWLLLRRRRVPLSTPLAITMSIYGAVALMLIKTFWDVTSRL